MTSLTRRVAGTITVLEALWLLFGSLAGPQVSGTTCLGSGCQIPQVYLWALFPLGAIILVAGALGVWGVSLAYLASAALSAVVLLVAADAVFALSGHSAFSAVSNEAAASSVLAIVAIIGNVLGIRAKSTLSEQANPLNLPVFG